MRTQSFWSDCGVHCRTEHSSRLLLCRGTCPGSIADNSPLIYHPVCAPTAHSVTPSHPGVLLGRPRAQGMGTAIFWHSNKIQSCQWSRLQAISGVATLTVSCRSVLIRSPGCVAAFVDGAAPQELPPAQLARAEPSVRAGSGRIAAAHTLKVCG